MGEANEEGFKPFDRDFWRRLLRTSIIFFIFVAKVKYSKLSVFLKITFLQGTIEGIRGPMLLSLSTLLHSDVKDVSQGMIGSTVGAVIGTAMGRK